MKTTYRNKEFDVFITELDENQGYVFIKEAKGDDGFGRYLFRCGAIIRQTEEIELEDKYLIAPYDDKRKLLSKLFSDLDDGSISLLVALENCDVTDGMQLVHPKNLVEINSIDEGLALNPIGTIMVFSDVSWLCIGEMDDLIPGETRVSVVDPKYIKEAILSRKAEGIHESLVKIIDRIIAKL